MSECAGIWRFQQQHTNNTNLFAADAPTRSHLLPAEEEMAAPTQSEAMPKEAVDAIKSILIKYSEETDLKLSEFETKMETKLSELIKLNEALKEEVVELWCFIRGGRENPERIHFLRINRLIARNFL